MRDSKKLRWLVGSVALSALVGIGCGSDDDDGGGSPNPTNTPGGNTPVPTATAPDNTPVPTATPGGDDTPTPGSVVSAQVQAFVGSALGSIGDLGMTGQASGAGAGPLPFPITSPCMPSGTVTLDCVQGGGGITFSNDFDMCRSQVPGLNSFIDGEVTIESNGTCLNPFPTGSPATVTFVGDLDISSAGGTFAGTLDVVSDVTVLADGTSMIDSSGSITSDCIGGTATFETTETIVTPPNGTCPTAGRVEFDIDGASHDAEYMSDGGVVIDGETFDSCEDLAQCS